MAIPISRRLLFLGIMLSTSLVGRATAAPSDAELLAGADARIEKHRKADAAISVVDTAGQPLANAEIDVQQTRHAFLFGCNIFCWDGLPEKKLEQAYRQRFAELLNYATLPFYWSGYETERGKPAHKHTEEVARWCQQHGIQTKGHPLAWNCGDAPWFPDDPDELYRLQLGRIDDCVKRFAGLIDRWDVVNEATEYDRVAFLKLSPKHSAMWKKVGQVAFPRECFLHARQANPKATLVINDYYTGPAYERFLEQLVDRQGKPVYDVIGIQSHMHGGVWSMKEIWRVCQQFARFGAPLHFTETTILSGDRGWATKAGWPSTPQGEARQAQDIVRFYTLLFSHPAVQAITWWDFCDWYSDKNAPAGFLRKDMSPKPAYDELKRLIKGKWRTKTHVQTAADGSGNFRGFLGNYRLTVRTAGKPPVVKEVSLARGTANRFTITVP
jgi:GH35 family endo-1,4-beta-xylanase